MKNESKKNATTTEKPKLSMDPIDVAMRALSEARVDFKRIKEIGKAANPKQAADPKAAEMRKELAVMKATRATAMEAVKKAKEELIKARGAVKALSPRKKVLRTELKKFAKTHTKHAALDEARVVVLEAELAYRKACMG